MQDCHSTLIQLSNFYLLRNGAVHLSRPTLMDLWIRFSTVLKIVLCKIYHLPIWNVNHILSPLLSHVHWGVRGIGFAPESCPEVPRGTLGPKTPPKFRPCGGGSRGSPKVPGSGRSPTASTAIIFTVPRIHRSREGALRCKASGLASKTFVRGILWGQKIPRIDVLDSKSEPFYSWTHLGC